MNIYDPQVLSERTINNFIPTRLAIKELNGVLYFCKTSRENIIEYRGSGIKWKNIVKKYGKENIKTLWVSDWYCDPYEIQEVALHFSKENQIVESNKWANLIPENGLNGGPNSKGKEPPNKGLVSPLKGKPMTRRDNSSQLSKEANEKRSRTMTGKKRGPKSQEEIERMRVRSTGVKQTAVTIEKRASKLRGRLPWNKGKSASSESRLNQSNAQKISTIFTFKHKDGATFTGTMYDFVSVYNLHNVSRLCRGIAKSVKGWTIS
jgi:hypothetical protein